MIAKKMPMSYKYGIIGKISKKLRGFLAKGFCTYIGKNVNIERNALFSSKLSIGDFSGIGPKCELSGPLYIGKNVMMGPEVIIYTRNHKTENKSIPMMFQGYTVDKEVTINDDVWIGRRVIILPGVTIGKGSIIGAGSVVARDIPSYSVAVGNPCRVVKKRGTEKINSDKQEENI